MAPLGGAPSSKWEDSAAKALLGATGGHMMVDTGAAVTLVTKRWAEAHGLKVSPTSGVAIKGAAGHAVEVVGTTSFTVQLAPTLEVDVAGVTVSAGDFYQALLGCDLLNGKRGILGSATVVMGDCVQWKQEKAGCIAVAEFLAKTPSANAAGGWLPPPPPPAGSAVVQTTFEQEGVKLDAKNMEELRRLAVERDEQRRTGTATTG